MRTIKSFSVLTLLSFTAVTLLATAAPASAQSLEMEEGVTYDGYCYSKKSDRAVEDALVGAAAGGAAGALLSKKGKKKKGAVIGAVVGGAAGAYVGSEAAKKIKCHDNKYFVYTKSNYKPSHRDKFKIVYFVERPEGVDLYYKNAAGEEVPYKP